VSSYTFQLHFFQPHALPSQHPHPSRSVHIMVLALDSLPKFFHRRRHPRNSVHYLRPALSLHQCTLAYNVRVCTCGGNGVLRASGLCRYWLVGLPYLECLYAELTCYFRLISASVGTVVHYGFQCHPNLGKAFLMCCFLTGLAGNVFPFMNWFNQYKYRVS
jgi:hypothetical protein